MATPKQIAANRRNAQKSTGPKTAQGKHNSSKNSVKHGILARVVPHETEGWQELLTGLYESLRPQDELQRFLVDQIAHCILRLQRSAAYEQHRLDVSRLIPLPPGRQYDMEEPATISPAGRLADFMNGPFFPNLLRYETACNRQIKRNLELLLKLQATPRATQSPACPYLQETDDLEGAAPSAPPLTLPSPSRPEGDWRYVSQPGPSGPGHRAGHTNDWDTENRSSQVHSPLEGEGRMPAPIASGRAPETSGEGRPNGLHTVSDNELASFGNNVVTGVR